MIIYLASGLGFSPELRDYKQRIIERLRQLGHDVLDPWAQLEFEIQIAAAQSIVSTEARRAALRSVAREIGASNERMIRNADVLFAVLDGLEVDSGVAAEAGMAFAIGKRCYGLRTDTRLSGEFEGTPFNLQLLYFIEGNGGKVFRSIGGIELPALELPQKGRALNGEQRKRAYAFADDMYNSLRDVCSAIDDHFSHLPVPVDIGALCFNAASLLQEIEGEEGGPVGGASWGHCPTCDLPNVGPGECGNCD